MANVVIVAPEDLPIPPHQGGSVQIYLHALMKAHAKSGRHRLTLISPGDDVGSAYRHIVPTQHLRKNAYRKFVRSILERLQPDIIQIENRPDFVPLIRSWFPGAKVVLNMHSTTFVGPRHVNPTRVPSILYDCHRVVFNSRYLLSTYKRKFRLSSRLLSSVIYPGVTSMEHTTQAQNYQGESTLQVLFVGRIIRQKGLHVLIKAINQLRMRGVRIQLTVVGRTPPWERNYAKEIKNMIRNSPTRCVGFVAPNELPKFYRRAHVFVCPSQKNEAFGLVNLEALSAGVPVISSAQGGIREIINEECGILVQNYQQPAGFADAIYSLYRNPDLLMKLQRGTKKRALQFSWNRTARKFDSLYDDVMRIND